MRAMYLLVALALLAAVCEGTSSSNIMADAHHCCAVNACSAEQKASLRARIDTYDGPDAQATRAYGELALSGAGCTGSGRSKRAVGDFISLTCPSGPYDVQYGPVSIVCQVSAKVAASIYYIGMYASTYANGKYYTSTSANTYYPPANTTSATSQPFTFTMPQYAANGLWTVYTYVYDPTYSNYNSTTTTFNVAKTKNDVSPPTLTAFGPTLMNLNDDNKIFTFSAIDDLTGVNSLSVYCQNSSGTFIYGYWNAPYYSTTGSNGQTAVSASGLFTSYSGLIVAGVYQLYMYLSDVVGYTSYLSSSQLASMGLPSNITFASNNCSAGTSRPYNTTGACTICQQGTYSKDGAFKCNTCPPGTSSGVAGATSCTPCPAGQSGIGASWACSYCAAGTYSSYTGRYFCQPCPPGQNVSYIGATSCGFCPPGTYSTGGASTCTACPPGTYSSSYSSGATCTHCAPGTYTAVSGSAYCSPCTGGTYSGLGQTSCSPCPAPRVMSNAGSNSQLNCYQS